MSTNPEDRLLEEVLRGERARDDREFLELLERSDEARTRWARLESLATTLDEMGEVERDVRADARRLEVAGVEDLAERVRAELGPKPAAPRPGPRRWLWTAAAAAGLTAALWLGWQGLNPGSTPGAVGGSKASVDFEAIVLSEGSAELDGMSATQLEPGRYRLDWSDSAARFGRTYRVRFHLIETGGDGGAEGPRLGAAVPELDSQTLTDTSCTIALPQDVAPEDLAWSVEARAVDGELVATSSARRLLESRP